MARAPVIANVMAQSADTESWFQPLQGELVTIRPNEEQVLRATALAGNLAVQALAKQATPARQASLSKIMGAHRHVSDEHHLLARLNEREWADLDGAFSAQLPAEERLNAATEFLATRLARLESRNSTVNFWRDIPESQRVWFGKQASDDQDNLRIQ